MKSVRGNVLCTNLQVWVRDRNVVVLSLVLSQELEPSADGTPENLTYTKGQSTHEIVPGRPVPVPHLNGQTSVPLVATH